MIITIINVIIVAVVSNVKLFKPYAIMLRIITVEHKVEMQQDVIYSTMLTIVPSHALYALTVPISMNIAP